MSEGEESEVSMGGSSYKEIVMVQLKKVTDASNVEFRGGFYTIVTNKSGEDKEIYVQDSREVFSNGVVALAKLLKPKYDDTMRESFKKYKNRIKKITDKFIDDSSPDEEVVLGDSFYESTEDKIFLETYRNKKLKLHLYLYQEVVMLLSRHNFLDWSGGVF